MSSSSTVPRSRNRPLIVAVVLGVVAFVAVMVLPRLFGPDADSRPTGDCVPLVVSSSTEKDDLLRDLANEYNRAEPVIDGRCARVSVHELTSGTAMESLATGWNEERDGGPPPQVWTPTSSLWLGLLDQRDKGGLVVGEPESITKSVLTIAMPEQMAAVVREKFPEPGWSSVLELASGNWAALDHPEWGRFALGRDNPHVSTSGLAATVAIYHAAAGEPDAITEAKLDDANVRSFVHGVESAVSHYGDDATKFMQQMYDEDRRRPSVPYISGIVVQEQLAYQFNESAPGGGPAQMGAGPPPNDPLVAINPAEGTFELDHPYVVLSSASPTQRAIAEDFRAFLLEPEQQQRFAVVGFRDLDGRPSADLASTLDLSDSEQPKLIDPPPPEVVSKMVAGWDAARRRARVLVVLDVSGSMKEQVNEKVTTGDEAKRKIDLLRPAVLQGLRWLVDDDQVGLWTFSSGQPKPYTVQVPISRVGDVRTKFTNVVNTVSPSGDTALYQTTREAHRMMLDSIDPNRINAIVLLTDGVNTPTDPAGRAAMLKEVDASQRDESVRIFTIPYGRQADVRTLSRIAAVSKALTYDAVDPVDINKVFVSVFSNF
ncbi:substrate-binding domain-containing protein [Actinophytocola sp.]|uniref:substrate-binding domain-containing protein n=1 Tax=Actinophytocola sp. TaxID=1872138 RepID=UPI003D6B5044